MNIVDKVFEFLQSEGLQPQRDQEDDIFFKYQRRNFYYSNPGNDEDFFRMYLPQIDDVTEDNREAMLEAANNVNKGMKLAKVCVTDTAVHVMVEIFLDHDPELEDIIPRTMQVLIDSQQRFYQELQ